jgi:HAD superfamily hydrolase (TIGR01549 family)
MSSHYSRVKSGQMTKAVFFDLYQTLVWHDPPPEEVQKKVLKEFGIDVTLEAVHHAMVIADAFIYQEHARSPLSKRAAEEKMALYTQYQGILLREAGIDASNQLIVGTLSRMQQFEFRHVLFDDVVPALTRLKDLGLILGLISNVERDMSLLYEELGLAKLLQVVVTSQDTGLCKPRPEIFQQALRQSQVEASEAVYVGDQYQIDVVGANEAGMKGVLLDRRDEFGEVADCPRIQSLTDLIDLL